MRAVATPTVTPGCLQISDEGGDDGGDGWGGETVTVVIRTPADACGAQFPVDHEWKWQAAHFLHLHRRPVHKRAHKCAHYSRAHTHTDCRHPPPLLVPLSLTVWTWEISERGRGMKTETKPLSWISM